MSDEKDVPRYTGSKPTLALRRFAGDLEKSSNPDTAKFRDINRSRVESFIRRPYEEIAKIRDEYHPPQKEHTRKGFYDYSTHSTNIRLHLDAPELQRSLGPQSRFGDGDGSFWDKWVVAQMPSKGLGIDEHGLPIAGQCEVATTGFKRLYNNRSHDKASTAKPRTRAIIQPYNERRAKRLAMGDDNERAAAAKKEEATAAKRTVNLSEAPSAEGLRGADWSAVEEAVDEKVPVAPSPIKLPPVSAIEREAYFGNKARAEFLDIFRQLSRQRHIYTDSTYDVTDAIVKADCKTRPRKLVKGKSGRFDLDAINMEPKSPTNERPSGGSRRSTRGLRTYGESGVLVRTNTGPTDSTLEGTERAEEEVLKPHLSLPAAPGAIPRPLSPRSRFLLGCLNSKVIPRPAMLIRKEMTSVLNLEHQYIGDTGALLLANSLDGLPYLSELNIGDNKLTDKGLTAIIKALPRCPYLTSLDVSENKIDEEAAAAISSYLTSKECALVNFVLRKSDVDDNEIGSFIEAIGKCTSLKSIDLSANLVGSNQNKTPLHPGLTCGGEVLGKMLSESDCRIESLKLAWNMIRFDSGVKLMCSLKENSSLTYLDVSYNGLGQDGAEMLGDALHINRTLRNLLVSNNNITSKGCFCIVSGIRNCTTLQQIDLSNNPIGERGAQAAMMLVTEIGHRLKIDLRGCSIGIKDSSFTYDMEYPENDYNLNLLQPFERAVCVEMLRTSARSRGKIQLEKFDKAKNFKYTPDPAEDTRGTLPMLLEVVKEPAHDDYERGLLPPNEAVDKLRLCVSPKSRDSFFSLIDKKYEEITHRYERDNKLNASMVSKLLNQIDFGWYTWVEQHLFSMYDCGHSGYVTLDEFKEFFDKMIHLYVKQWRDTVFSSTGLFYYACDEERFLLPAKGSISCRLVLSHSSPGIEHQWAVRTLLSKENMDNILSSLKMTDNSLRMCEYALTNCSLSFPEAWNLYNFMIKESGDKGTVLHRMLPLMSNIYEARLLIHQTLEKDIDTRVHLRSAMGGLYRVSMGYLTGYYCLRLNWPNDRMCLGILYDLCKRASKYRRDEMKLGDTSQSGNFFGFRNCHFDGHLADTPFDITDEWFANMPRKGKLEFDFVHFQPLPSGTKAMANDRFLEILTSMNILPDTNEEETDEVLKAMGMDNIVVQSSKTKTAEDIIAVPDDHVIQNVVANSKIDVDKMNDYVEWCESNKAHREGSIFPKKFIAVSKPPSARLSRGVSRSKTSTPRTPLRKKSSSTEWSSAYGSAPPSRDSADERCTPRLAPPAPPTPISSDFVVENIGCRALSCKQLAFIVYRMGQQDPEMLAEGMRKAYGSTRVEVIVSLFNQIVDLVNLPYVLKLLSPFERGSLVFRLGWLNVWSPLRPDGFYRLRLHNREERQIVRVLIALATEGSSDQWKNCRFSENANEDPLNFDNDWSMPSSWRSESGLPREGVLRLQFQSSGASGSESSRFKSDSVHTTLLATVFASPVVDRAARKPGIPLVTLTKANQLAEQLGLAFNFGVS
mmetsp:Transcript_23200/g.34037  ORF Transcript_23200/g.34037 Transcript_23200/m.34037 type:complete len:1514 (+) Transcript_23200:117-4658(+)